MNQMFFHNTNPRAHWSLLAVCIASLLTGCALSPGKAQRAGDSSQARMQDLTGQWTEKPVVCMQNFYNMYNPHVVYDARAGEYPYKMWFFGWSAAEYNQGMNVKSDAIFYARSQDMKNWDVYCGQGIWDKTMNPKLWFPVMYAASEPKFDSEGNGDPSVVLKDGVLYMAFSSIGFDIQNEGGKDHIYLVNNVMGATSMDGIHWEKSPGPVLIWSEEFKNRWELIPGQDNSEPPADYYGSYHRPSLMFDEGKWKIWFDYFHPGTFVSLGYAECVGDFMKPGDWKVLRAGKQPLLKNWPNPDVVKAGKMYYAFCDSPYYPESMGGDTRQITVAQSRDGLAWTVLGHIRPEGLASSHVPEAFVQTEGKDTWLYIFYSWKPEHKKDQAWDYRYKQIRYIRRPLTGAELGE